MQLSCDRGPKIMSNRYALGSLEELKRDVEQQVEEMRAALAAADVTTRLTCDSMLASVQRNVVLADWTKRRRDGAPHPKAVGLPKPLRCGSTRSSPR